MAILGYRDEMAATAATAMTAEMVLLVPKEIRVILVLRELLELRARVAQRETRVTLVRKALAALRGLRVLEAKQAPMARTDCRVRGAFQVSMAATECEALLVPLGTLAGMDLWGPRATKVVQASQVSLDLKATEVHLVKMDVMASKAQGADQESLAALALREREGRQESLVTMVRTEKMVHPAA